MKTIKMLHDDAIAREIPIMKDDGIAYLYDFLQKHKDKKLYYCSTKARKNYCDVKFEDDCFLLFGKETKGLPEDLIYSDFENAIRIPMKGEVRSLNLSNSVAIVLYEALRQQGFYGFDDYLK